MLRRSMLQGAQNRGRGLSVAGIPSGAPFILRSGSGGHIRAIVGVLLGESPLDAVMRRTRLTLLALPALLLIGLSISLPAAARTSAMMNGGDESSECPDVAAGAAGSDEDAAAHTPKPAAAAKRGAVPARAKPRSTPRGGNPDAPARGPRWHRFLPGMFR
jgi:hypothetical protein